MQLLRKTLIIMQRILKRKMIGTLVVILSPLMAFAQLEQSLSTFENIIEQIVRLAPLLLLGGFLVGVLTNIGKIWGQDKDYVGFFRNCIIYVIAVAVIVGIAAWIRGVNL